MRIAPFASLPSFRPWMFAFALLLGAPAHAFPGFPAYVSLPPEVLAYDENSLVKEDFAEVEFPLAEGRNVTQRGRHFRSYARWADADNKPAAETWARWWPALKASGWSLQGQAGEAPIYSLRRQAGGTDSWLRVSLGDYTSPLLELIEITGKASTLVLEPPAARPEKIGDKDDFPYLRKPEGAVLSGTAYIETPLDVTVGGVDRETQLVGRGYQVKTYRPPSTLSKLDFETRYREALVKAGWEVKPAADGKPGEGVIVARYAKQGRHLWAVLGRGNDDSDAGLAFKIADLGAEDWSAALHKDCHVALYGVNFDFNQASLRPDSTPVLDKLLAVLRQDAALALEIEGHTDNVGGDPYNLKLSDARARTVVEWLVKHGIAATRLSAHGYGLRQPIVDNATDEGRARNRRVELRRRDCVAP